MERKLSSVFECDDMEQDDIPDLIQEDDETTLSECRERDIKEYSFNIRGNWHRETNVCTVCVDTGDDGGRHDEEDEGEEIKVVVTTNTNPNPNLTLP